MDEQFFIFRGRKHRVFEIPNTSEKVIIAEDRYQANNKLALFVLEICTDEDSGETYYEDYAFLTVNTFSPLQEGNRVVIKNYSENEFFAEWLASQIGTRVGQVDCGHVKCPLYEIDLTKIYAD